MVFQKGAFLGRKITNIRDLAASLLVLGKLMISLKVLPFNRDSGGIANSAPGVENWRSTVKVLCGEKKRCCGIFWLCFHNTVESQ